MRDRVIATAAVASAGLAVAVGFVIGSLGGAFDDSSRTVRPPALRSENAGSFDATTSSTIVVVPPSPSWQIAVPTTPRPTTPAPAPSETALSEPAPSEPSLPETADRTPRGTTRADRTTIDVEDSDSENTSTTTTTETSAQPAP